MPTDITRAAARAHLLVATTLTEFPGGDAVLGETVAAALRLRSCRVVDFGEAGIVVQPNPRNSTRRYVIR